MSSRACLVDFYLYSSHEVAVWEPLYRALRRRGVDARIVLEPPGIHRAMGSVPDPMAGWKNDLTGPIEPLVDPATHDKLCAFLGSRGLPWIDRSRRHADAVITTQGIGWIQHYRGLKIKTEYGASAFVDVFGHGAVNIGLDLVLAHGPYSAASIGRVLPEARIAVVGYPKWSPALRDRLDRAEARRRLGIAGSDPVVAWLPTWAHNATIETHHHAMEDLARDHLVVLKPHHNNVRFEQDRLDVLSEHLDLRHDLDTLVELMVAADVVVADGRSGALAETIMADRPAVGLLPGCSAREHGIIGGLEDAVVWCSAPSQLRDAVHDALTTDRSSGRARWRPWLFADMDGRDDEVAADAVIAAIRGDLARSTGTGMDLAALDVVADGLATSERFAEQLEAAWRTWPGHPRLIAALAERMGSLSLEACVTLAAVVRHSGHRHLCPLLDAVNDPSMPVVERLGAAAVLATALEEDMVDTFAALAEAVETADVAAAFERLDVAPEAIPFFIEIAASTAPRCEAIADALGSLGAADEADAVRAHGRRLVTA